MAVTSRRDWPNSLKLDLSGVDADADAKFSARQAEGVLEPRSPFATPLLDAARRLQGTLDMVAVAHREIEDRHDGVTHGLVEQSVRSQTALAHSS